MKSKKSLNAKLLINPPFNLTETNIKDDIYLRKKVIKIYSYKI